MCSVVVNKRPHPSRARPNLAFDIRQVAHAAWRLTESPDGPHVAASDLIDEIDALLASVDAGRSNPVRRWLEALREELRSNWIQTAD